MDFTHLNLRGMTKPRIIKDYDDLKSEVINQILSTYPNGFEKKLIQFKDPKGKLISALPFETEDYYYLIRMSRAEAMEMMTEDHEDQEVNDKEVEDIYPEYDEKDGEDFLEDTPPPDEE